MKRFIEGENRYQSLSVVCLTACSRPNADIYLS